ncbi:MAG: hypothetical protein OHK0012_04920 [Synechococcales cyanobacterium]
MIPDLLPNQALAAQMIALGTPYTLVAAECGVDRQTIRRWRQLPEFKEYLGSLVEETDTAARHKIQTKINLALDSVMTALSDPSCPWAVKLGAATLVLRLAEDWKPPVHVKEESRVACLSPDTLKFIRSEVYGL